MSKLFTAVKSYDFRNGLIVGIYLFQKKNKKKIIASDAIKRNRN